ncbi:GlxA family transcriptional regulator [Kitasatospora cineracea]|uniref:AraC family transcriptional regulator with amidase-like domain n=1 Tax=Kitasatospora cineracea TaxID=88074 RepID=A0A3N4RP42_9ACTN|nr:helix-turn-helix domain-containing protein [Kitasatospora cineracea]RPE32879.1 AraC family transcriptional regulator with amidase-like domain [Kitasatospora cineracea]
MATAPAPPPHRVAVLALDGVYPFELGIPKRVFGSTDGLYRLSTCTVDGRPVHADADFTVAPDHGPEVLAEADTVVIPPFAPVPETAVLDPATAAALALVRPGTRLISICTGAFVLAAAGLLDGRPATTHWALADRFRALFPRVRLDPDVLFVDDGDVLTSAGAASGIDLFLHVLRSDHGTAAANRAARICVVPPWREGGQAQYVVRPVPTTGSTGTAPTREWALTRLHRPLTLAELAAHAAMSTRTFARRFQEETGQSPGRWLTQQRIALARHLLEATDLTIDQIATRVGFANPVSLRQHLHSAIGVSPLAYRRTFAGTAR